MALTKLKRRKRIKMRIRRHVSGTQERPRMSVFRSNKGIYVQLIDDLNGKTLVAADSREKTGEDAKKVAKAEDAKKVTKAGDAKKVTKAGDAKKVTKTLQAKQVGKLIAEKSLEKGISTVVFDRNGYLYHGRVKALADAAREAGLKF